MQPMPLVTPSISYFCMHTHYYSLLGACTRMIIFACELGASVVDFVGMDGYKSIKEGKHGFQVIHFLGNGAIGELAAGISITCE